MVIDSKKQMKNYFPQELYRKRNISTVHNSAPGKNNYTVIIMQMQC